MTCAHMFLLFVAVACTGTVSGGRLQLHRSEGMARSSRSQGVGWTHWFDMNTVLDKDPVVDGPGLWAGAHFERITQSREVFATRMYVGVQFADRPIQYVAASVSVVWGVQRGVDGQQLWIRVRHDGSRATADILVDANLAMSRAQYGDAEVLQLKQSVACWPGLPCEADHGIVVLAPSLPPVTCCKVADDIFEEDEDGCRGGTTEVESGHCKRQTLLFEYTLGGPLSNEDVAAADSATQLLTMLEELLVATPQARSTLWVRTSSQAPEAPWTQKPLSLVEIGGTVALEMAGRRFFCPSMGSRQTIRGADVLAIGSDAEVAWPVPPRSLAHCCCKKGKCGDSGVESVQENGKLRCCKERDTCSAAYSQDMDADPRRCMTQAIFEGTLAQVFHGMCLTWLSGHRAINV